MDEFLPKQPRFNALDALCDKALKITGQCYPVKNILRDPSGLLIKPRAAPKAAKIEIVSHCWQYAHLLAYQLWSIAEHEPLQNPITMTVFFSAEDQRTAELLNYFSTRHIPNVTWNWRSLPREFLFRRAIGRNLAAQQTQADWIWFTDSDLLFGAQTLNRLGPALAGTAAPLVFPAKEYRSLPLPPRHPLLDKTIPPEYPRAVSPDLFKPTAITRATGPLQIVHGDVARACGYCAKIPIYQKPARHWCKANEDRIFRQVLGTQGAPVNVGPVYRLQHQVKGRYQGEGVLARLRFWNQMRFSHQ